MKPFETKREFIEKPWGHEVIADSNPAYVIKELRIKPGHRLSLQHHELKTETLSLCAAMQIFPMEVLLNGERMESHIYYRINPGDVHRLANIGPGVACVHEVSTPELDDVVRHEDDYGR